MNKNYETNDQRVVIPLTLTMALNVPDYNSEEVHDKNTGAFSVPLNGVQKVK